MERLLEKRDTRLAAADGADEPPEWVQEAYRGLREMLLDPRDPFPCYFGTIAERLGTLRYTYLEEEEVGDPIGFRDSMLAFLKEIPSVSGRSALIVFVGEKTHGNALDTYETIFWNLMQYLHDHDPQPWPAHIPTDPDDPGWEFCFAGVTWFFTGHAPAYQRRKSRSADGGLMLIIQTRDNLQGIVGTGLVPESVRRRIRTSVNTYDAIPVSPELQIYGEPATREWKQYWLLDSNNSRDGTCPLIITRCTREGEKATTDGG